MEAHPYAARGFSGVAEEYERARPGYPEEAIAWLAGRLGLVPGATVVDLGAGTGKLTRQLLPLGVRVVAVEPLAPMRDALARAVPEADVVAGSAERIPLPDGGVDAVTAGQAAHWFRTDETGAELTRVLRPGGGVGLLWNTRDVGDPLQAAIEEVVSEHRLASPREAWERRRWREAFEGGAFTPIEHASFGHVHELAAADVPALVASMSWVGALPDDEREAVLARAREVAEASRTSSSGPEEDRVRLLYRTDAYACRRL